MKIFHLSIYDDSESTYVDKDENNDENSPKTPYDGENMNDSSDDEVNNDEDTSETPYNDENINYYSNNEGNNYEVALDPPTNDVNINANSDDEKNIIRLPLIHLQMYGIMKQLTMMKKKITKKTLRKK